MTNFALLFCVALIVNAALTFRSSDYYRKWQAGQGDATLSAPTDKEDASNKEKWIKLIKKYLPVYLLSTLSDWLQGPYVYALYQDYGYAQHKIAVLFVAGFGSSMVFGSFVGGMADWGGRRTFVVVYTLVYAASCLTKHFKNFYILMLGRLLGGVATSLLFSVFDAWLIRAHNDAQVKQFLGKSFSYAAYGNSIIAILAGLVANKSTTIMKMTALTNVFYFGGCLFPFDVAMIALLTAGFLALTTWEENYGEQEDSDNRTNHWYDGLKNAFTSTIRSTDVLLCGIVSSLFEGSMYIFVFMWTPALSAGYEQPLPFGLIFSTFMVCCMAGSSVYNINSDHFKNEQLAAILLPVAAASMFLVASSKSTTLKFLAMNLFEMTVGMYWPIMGTMKGTIVPESMRAAIYNLYRIPLNFIVVSSLLADMSPRVAFGLNALMLSIATGLQLVLMKRRELNGIVAAGVSSNPTRNSSSELSLDKEPLIDKKDESV